MKECQTWSWHVQLHHSVYVNRHQHATPKWFLYHDQTTCVCYSLSGTPSRSQGWLCQFPEISLMPIQSTLLCLCVYLGLTHSSKDTLDLILSLSTSATCQGTEWIKPWAKARCSEAEKRPAPAGSLFLMVSLDKLGMLDTASLYSSQILTLKSIITLQSKSGRALPDTEPVGSTAVEEKGSEGKLLPAAAVLSAGPAHHQKTCSLQRTRLSPNPQSPC